MKILKYLIILWGVGLTLFVVWPKTPRNIGNGGFYSIYQATTTPSVPGGSDTQVQFNQSGSLAGSSNLTWLNNTGALGVGTTTPGASITVDNGDIYIASSTRGVIERINSTTCMRAIPNLAGNFTTSSVACP